MLRWFASMVLIAALATPTRGADEDRVARFAALHGYASEDLSDKVDLRYPVVLAHGVTWFNALNIERLKSDYWQGIDDRFRSLGVSVIAPEVPALGSVAERAAALKAAIDSAYPGRRVNIVAHSMGGLDARYMITMLGMGHRVASLTTVSTPHHGSYYADFAKTYIFKWQGLDWLFGKVDINPKAVGELTVHNMENYFNATVKDDPQVAYFSWAGVADLWEMPITQWGMKLIVSLAERRAAGKALGPAMKAALDKQIPHGSEEVEAMALGGKGWVRPEEAGRSDGVVSTSSARWGTYLGELRGYHLAQIGTSRRVDHIKLWETVLRKLASLGY